jgi:hypothetical protein
VPRCGKKIDFKSQLCGVEYWWRRWEQRLLHLCNHQPWRAEHVAPQRRARRSQLHRSPAASHSQALPLPYEVHASGARGLLLVSKSSKPMRVQLQGAGLTDTAATVLDGTLDGVTLDPEPGFVAPLVRRVGSDGSLALGPYAIALVDAGQAAPMSADSSKA